MGVYLLFGELPVLAAVQVFDDGDVDGCGLLVFDDDFVGFVD